MFALERAKKKKKRQAKRRENIKTKAARTTSRAFVCVTGTEWTLRCGTLPSKVHELEGDGADAGCAGTPVGAS